MLGVEQFFAEQARGGFRDFRVFAPVVVFGPAIEMEMHDGGFLNVPPASCRQNSFLGSSCRQDAGSTLALHKDRPGVARPAAIGGVRNEFNLPHIHADVLENAARKIFVSLVPDDEAHVFARRNFPHHFTVNPRDDLELARPVAGVVRPAEPGGLVLFPFGGHGIALFGGRGGADFVRRWHINWREGIGFASFRKAWKTG